MRVRWDQGVGKGEIGERVSAVARKGMREKGAMMRTVWILGGE